MLYLRGRYDIRSLFLVWSMALRLAGVAVGAHYGLAEAIAGVLAAQVASTASVGVVGWLAFRRFPQRRARPLGEDRREIVSFVAAVERRRPASSRCAAASRRSCSAP